MAAIDSKDHDKLEAIIQAVEPATRFEHLIAALLGDLIGTSVAVAKSGFQHGSGAGTNGRQERFLAVLPLNAASHYSS